VTDEAEDLWRALLEAASPAEVEVLKAIALRTGYFWKCERCGRFNDNDSSVRGHCWLCALGSPAHREAEARTAEMVKGWHKP
jgi:hypothetical protein